MGACSLPMPTVGKAGADDGATALAELGVKLVLVGGSDACSMLAGQADELRTRVVDSGTSSKETRAFGKEVEISGSDSSRGCKSGKVANEASA